MDIRQNTLPFVRYMVPAGAGIACAILTGVGWSHFAAALGIVWLSAWLIRSDTLAGMYTWLSVLLFFAAATSFSSRTGREDLGTGSKFIAEVVTGEEPLENGRWQSASGYITAYRHEGISPKWETDGFGIRLYADTALSVSPGERIMVRGAFYPFDSKGSSYESLMVRRGTAGRMYAGPHDILAVSGSSKLNLTDRLHNAAVRKFASLPPANLTGVAAAMVTGDKRNISREVRRRYSDGGGAHLLAVSGLHVGIVFVLVNLFLYFIPSLRKGHIVKNILAIAAVWLFAAAAGLSPSVVRSALMFSFAQFALARGTVRSAVNILAASAFLMLAINPNYGSDPSFVLSYAAVLSIILFFGPVFRLVKTGNRIVDGVLSVYIVGIAASLASAPFVSYWFGAVPIAGIIVNPLVILTAHVIVAMGVLWLVWPFGLGSGVFAKALGFAETFQNRIMEWCAGVKWGLIEVRLPLVMALTAYVLIIISAIYLRKYADARDKLLPLPE